MRKLLFIFQFIFFILFNLALLLTVFQMVSSDEPDFLLTDGRPTYDNVEDYDPSLGRLNSFNSLTSYTDSVYEAARETSFTAGDAQFAKVAYDVVRKRFFHGFSEYGKGSNVLLTLVSKASLKGLNAIVLPDDILKYPFAACSQQSIVLMEMLKEKGYQTRKVGLQGQYNGHFCFEVYYDGSWHFYDPDMEPDMAVLDAYGRPDIAFLASRPDIVLKAYDQHPPEKITDLFSSYSYGKINAFEASRVALFHKLTRLASYTTWIFFLLAFIVVRKMYLKRHHNYVRNNRIHIPAIQGDGTTIFNTEYTA